MMTWLPFCRSTRQPCRSNALTASAPLQTGRRILSGNLYLATHDALRQAVLASRLKAAGKRFLDVLNRFVFRLALTHATGHIGTFGYPQAGLVLVKEDFENPVAHAVMLPRQRRTLIRIASHFSLNGSM